MIARTLQIGAAARNPPGARMTWAGLALALIAGAFLAPAMPLTVDGALYLRMAQAMAEHGALHIAERGGVEDAPALARHFGRVVDGRVYPQYPSGYALIAAPFYVAFGVRGLMLMNALATAACIFFVFRITRRFGCSKEESLGAAAIFAVASYIGNYAFAIWPHALSLFFHLAAVACVVEGNGVERFRRRFSLLLSGGLLIGIAINIRLDAILLFGVLFAWLKLAARPGDRLSPLALAAGLAPGLAIAAWLNYAKFGVANPLSYGVAESRMSSLTSYAPMFVGGVALLIVLWAFNTPAMLRSAYHRLGWGPAAILFVVGAFCIALAVSEAAGRIAYGAYVLIFDLQAHNAYAQAGVERNAFGQLTFFGYPKRALIQSLPFLPLAMIPVILMLQGAEKRRSLISLCVLAISAPVSFYAWNQWHGGGSYNLRYLLPALPYIAILTAVGIGWLSQRANMRITPSKALQAAAAAAIVWLAAWIVGRAEPRFDVPASLYPQWIIAFACFAAIVAALLQPASVRRSRAALAIGMFAIAYGAAVCLEDEVAQEGTRFTRLAQSQAIAAALPPGALVLTNMPELFVHAERDGVSIFSPDEANSDSAVAAVAAFSRANRCVYAQGKQAIELLPPSIGDSLDARPFRIFSGRAYISFYALSSQYERCRIRFRA